MQQNKIEILSTGQLDEPVVSSAELYGLHIDRVLFISIHETEDEQVISEIASFSQQQKTVIFTSSNAVRSVLNHLQNPRPSWKIYCIGTATRNLAAGTFGRKAIKATANSSAELAGIILKEGMLEEIIFFCGNIRRDELPDQLKKNNIRVKECKVYETVPQPCRIEKKYDGILFFSPSEVKSFFSLNKPAKETILFAIGETTGAEIKNHSMNTVIICSTPGKQALIDQAVQFFLSPSKAINLSQSTSHE